jgi:hypothetical protein
MISMAPSFKRLKPVAGKLGAPRLGVLCDQTELKVKAAALAMPVARKWRRCSIEKLQKVGGEGGETLNTVQSPFKLRKSKSRTEAGALGQTAGWVTAGLGASIAKTGFAEDVFAGLAADIPQARHAPGFSP